MSGLFPDIALAVLAFRAGRLKSPLLSGYTFDDLDIQTALLAAENDAEHALRTFFGPVVVLPESETQAERDALDEAGTRWVDDPGHDMEPDFFNGERWGYLVTRHKPIRSVAYMKFVYPQPISNIYEVPADWIRLDKKYGHVRLVPGSQAFAAPLAVWLLRTVGGGRTVPHMIQLRYTAGIDPAAFPDLADLVQRMAALRLLQGLFLPSSGSISADGLSESVSVDWAAYQSDIDARLERLRQAIHGVKVAFL